MASAEDVPYPEGHRAGASQRLNFGCFCVTLDRGALAEALDQEVGVAGFAATLAQTHPTLFSNVSVFVPAKALVEMAGVVVAVEAAARLAGFQAAALAWADPLAVADPGPLGVLMGYDFHLGADGAKLIEVNTNAGGAFLNAALARAQRFCCASQRPQAGVPGPAAFATRVAEMFLSEWRLQRGEGRPRRIAILDDAPATQHLLPEFRLAQALLRAQGLETVIADPADLIVADGEVRVGGQAIDLVYNRLVDFALQAPAHAALREAYREGLVVVTPNPHVYALLADKRNLTLLSDMPRLREWGLGADHVRALNQAVPPAVQLSPANADQLWAERRNLFFKPACGHASKAAYRGDKITRRVWAEIIAGDFIAQAYAEPSLRRVRYEGATSDLKIDLRLYTYAGEVQLIASRLYRGQTTNMRTPGGGFAPVLVDPANA